MTVHVLLDNHLSNRYPLCYSGIINQTRLHTDKRENKHKQLGKRKANNIHKKPLDLKVRKERQTIWKVLAEWKKCCQGF